jgi:hypothetical protein
MFFLPTEYKSQPDEEDEEESSVHLVLYPRQAWFDKPKGEKHRHLKALYLKGFVDGKPMTKMLVDGGAAIILMLYTTYRKPGKTQEDLIKTDMTLKDFGGNSLQARGFLTTCSLDVIEFMQTAVFLPPYQWLIQWQGDDVEVVLADTTISVATADASSWEFDGIECLSRKAWEGEFVLTTKICRVTYGCR